MHYFYGTFRACEEAARELGLSFRSPGATAKFLGGASDADGLRFTEGDTINGVYGAWNYSEDFDAALEQSAVRSGFMPPGL